MTNHQPIIGPAGTTITVEGHYLVVRLGYHVLAPRGREWEVETALGTYPFRDGMRIYRSPGGAARICG